MPEELICKKDEFDIKQETNTQDIYLLFIDAIRQNGTAYTDITGPFPITSNKGYQYMFVFYSYDANGVRMEPIKKQGRCRNGKGL